MAARPFAIQPPRVHNLGPLLSTATVPAAWESVANCRPTRQALSGGAGRGSWGVGVENPGWRLFAADRTPAHGPNAFLRVHLTGDGGKRMGAGEWSFNFHNRFPSTH